MRNNTSIGKSLADIFDQLGEFHPHNKRFLAFESYLNLLIKSGVINFCTKKIRTAYRIPSLDPDTDFGVFFYEIEGKEVDEDHFLWFEASKSKQDITYEIYELIRQFHLPRSSFNYILYLVQYNKKPPIDFPKYDYDFLGEIIFDQKPKDTIGFTPDEVGYYLSLWFIWAEKYLKDSESLVEKGLSYKEVLAEGRKKIINFCKKSPRRIRPRKKVVEDIKIIKFLKEYKSVKTYDNYAENKVEIEKQTSNIIADLLDDEGHIKTNKKRSATLRKRIQRLLEQFPIIEEMTSYSKSSKFLK